MAKHNRVGSWGEDIAVDTLVADGWAIVERNWRMGHFEIDLIAMKGQMLVVAEVKTRTDSDVDPLDAVDNRKILRMVKAADAFVRSRDLPHQVRFDLFAICGTPEKYSVEHIPDAFYPPLKSY